ncbi:hypothetical protein [Roseinatronobacter alkalisoli]|uniref:Uncharacterized protein n=1 Tax=Roseinatronobacter alkalisoli TaxID=3028235 RepID=A0ABT5TBN4_9RHOB|nr:hypothetical protein [Roseinatronobacter sp. HJB301]MDD7972411.1 hypothetical protein [Roseinatronobacter sp. HJB301]
MQFLSEYISPLAVSLSGLIALSVLHVLPDTRDDTAALIFPPTMSRAMILREVAQLGLPIRDLRWNGYLVELDLTNQPEQLRTGLAGLVSVPVIRLAARPAAFCATAPVAKEI